MTNGITLKVPDDLDVDIGRVLERVDSGDQHVLDELLGDVYLAAIQREKFPETCASELIQYCQSHSSFAVYVFEAAKQGNMCLAKELYDAGAAFWKRIGNDHEFTNLSQRYIDGTLEHMKKHAKEPTG